MMLASVSSLWTSPVRLWCQSLRGNTKSDCVIFHKPSQALNICTGGGDCCLRCSTNVKLSSRQRALISFHLVVFRSAEKTQDGTLVWGGIKVWTTKRLQEKKHGKKVTDEKPDRSYHFFFLKWDRTRHPLCVFSPLISNRNCSRQILSEDAVLVLRQSRENIIKCNSSAINYSSICMLLCFFSLAENLSVESLCGYYCISNNNLLPLLQRFSERILTVFNKANDWSAPYDLNLVAHKRVCVYIWSVKWMRQSVREY